MCGSGVFFVGLTMISFPSSRKRLCGSFRNVNYQGRDGVSATSQCSNMADSVRDRSDIKVERGMYEKQASLQLTLYIKFVRLRAG